MSLYDFSSDDLDQFSKLDDLINSDVKIYLPKQVSEEVARNRENKISDSLSKFRTINVQIPNLCKGYDEYPAFRALVKQVQESHRDLLKKVEQGIEEESLHADKVMARIFSKLEEIDTPKEIIERAIMRYETGNPPGKEKSYGDAINWETLLISVPEGEDLFFVSADKDYRSVVNESRFNSFLAKEWRNRKNSDIHFYRSLTEFFSRHLKDIELKTENQKNQLIDSLGDCGSFSSTHSVIAKLSEYSSWTDDQVVSLLKAAGSNNQVWAIMQDSDLDRFFTALVSGKTDKLFENSELHWILERIGFKNPNPPETADDDPF